MTVEFVTVATDELVKEGKIPRVFQEVEGDRPAVDDHRRGRPGSNRCQY